MKHKLIVAQHKWIELDYINELWFQVTGIHNCNVEARVGDVIRRTFRGWEVFESFDDTRPKHVIPTMVQLIDENDEEE
tara:strand:- start:385 stop:618 length:234 start_codon:yes stop_codon:yes gene_type:complete